MYLDFTWVVGVKVWCYVELLVLDYDFYTMLTNLKQRQCLRFLNVCGHKRSCWENKNKKQKCEYISSGWDYMFTRTHIYYMTRRRKDSDQVGDKKQKMEQKASTRLVLNSQVNVPSWFNRIVRGHGFSSGPVKKSGKAENDLEDLKKLNRNPPKKTPYHKTGNGKIWPWEKTSNWSFERWEGASKLMLCKENQFAGKAVATNNDK